MSRRSMSRRRETSWIHRWSRLLIAAIASIGAAGTAYLTIVKFLGGSAACPTSGCDLVLTSRYATVFGLPLTLFGCLAYLSMGILAVSPLGINPDQNKELRQKLESWTWLLLFIGSVSMAVFSGYLMYILTSEIKAACLYCIASALFTVSMLALTLFGRRWEDVGQLLFVGVISLVVVLTGTLAIYAPSDGGTASSIPGEAGNPITTSSGQAELALADHLTESGAKMYGAWWCPHCHDQKQLFGKEASKKIPYIECDSQGQNPQTELCRSIDEVRGYPTWEINGQFYSGSQALDTLANVSGYSGPRNFTN
ncbi:MAG: vitamin K epoxide reductase family protein [Leptolyngbyaceae cyanobacterium MO_188.B28]|nr:vitamin K epoxide reductase family protein [Leptolyngbyaceae cyanobacterium MO_188.B28]